MRLTMAGRCGDLLVLLGPQQHVVDLDELIQRGNGSGRRQVWVARLRPSDGCEKREGECSETYGDQRGGLCHREAYTISVPALLWQVPRKILSAAEGHDK